MWATLIWLELLALALLLWGLVVRGCSYFSTSWLRYAHGLIAWGVLCAVVAATAYRREAAKRFLPQGFDVRNTLDSLDALIGGGTWPRDVAGSLVVGSLLILLGGLSAPTLDDGRRIPRVRRRRWAELAIAPLMIVALMWAETAWIEGLLRREVEALGERGRTLLVELDRRHPRPPEQHDAGEVYRHALTGVKLPLLADEGADYRAVLLQLDDWHGGDYPPLTKIEEQAARRIVAAGKLPDAWFRAPSDGGISGAFDQSGRVPVLMLRRAVKGSDETLAESIEAVADLGTHMLRRPTYPHQFTSFEFERLMTVSLLAQNAPERLTAFTPARLADDDAEAILGPLEDEAVLTEGLNCREMGRLFDPSTDYGRRGLFSGGVHYDPGRNRKWYERMGGYVVQLAKIHRAVEAYRPRMESLRHAIHAAVAGGRPDVNRQSAIQGRGREARTIDEQYDDTRDYLIERSWNRFAYLGGRRLANVMIAAARFTERHGRLPKKLDELVPDFLEKVPADPFTGESIGMDTVPDGVVFYVRDSRYFATDNKLTLSDPDWPFPFGSYMTAVRLKRPANP